VFLAVATTELATAALTAATWAELPVDLVHLDLGFAVYVNQISYLYHKND